METGLSKIDLTAKLDRVTLERVVTFVENGIENGMIGGLEAIIISKWCKDLHEKLKASSTVKEESFKELRSYSEKEKVIINGCEISEGKTVKYFYDNTPIYEKLASQLEEIKAIAKSTKTVSSWTDADTGEVHDVYPAYRKEYENIKVKLPLK